MEVTEVGPSPWVLKRLRFEDTEFYRLNYGINTVGREPSSTISFKYTFISRHHCRFEVDQDEILIRDFSTNGIYVNDVHYSNSCKKLGIGDRIAIGPEYYRELTRECLVFFLHHEPLDSHLLPTQKLDDNYLPLTQNIQREIKIFDENDIICISSSEDEEDKEESAKENVINKPLTSLNLNDTTKNKDMELCINGPSNQINISINSSPSSSSNQKNNDININISSTSSESIITKTKLQITDDKNKNLDLNGKTESKSKEIKRTEEDRSRYNLSCSSDDKTTLLRKIFDKSNEHKKIRDSVDQDNKSLSSGIGESDFDEETNSKSKEIKKTEKERSRYNSCSSNYENNAGSSKSCDKLDKSKSNKYEKMRDSVDQKNKSFSSDSDLDEETKSMSKENKKTEKERSRYNSCSSNSENNAGSSRSCNKLDKSKSNKYEKMRDRKNKLFSSDSDLDEETNSKSKEIKNTEKRRSRYNSCSSNYENNAGLSKSCDKLDKPKSNKYDKMRDSANQKNKSLSSKDIRKEESNLDEKTKSKSKEFKKTKKERRRHNSSSSNDEQNTGSRKSCINTENPKSNKNEKKNTNIDEENKLSRSNSESKRTKSCSKDNKNVSLKRERTISSSSNNQNIDSDRTQTASSSSNKQNRKSDKERHKSSTNDNKNISKTHDDKATVVSKRRHTDETLDNSDKSKKVRKLSSNEEKDNRGTNFESAIPTMILDDDDDSLDAEYHLSQAIIKEIKQEVTDLDYNNEVDEDMFNSFYDDDDEDEYQLDENDKRWAHRLSQSLLSEKEKDVKGKAQNKVEHKELQSPKEPPQSPKEAFQSPKEPPQSPKEPELLKESFQSFKEASQSPKEPEPFKELQSIEKEVNEMTKEPIVQKQQLNNKRKAPEVIPAPSLPTKRGKLRGVSALAKVKVDEKEQELKKKWFQKPSTSTHDEKQRTLELKEQRKERLKEVEQQKQSTKQKLNDIDDDVKIVNRPKCKVTQQNRGLFLLQDMINPAPILNRRNSINTSNTVDANNSNHSKCTLQRRYSTYQISSTAGTSNSSNVDKSSLPENKLTDVEKATPARILTRRHSLGDTLTSSSTFNNENVSISNSLLKSSVNVISTTVKKHLKSILKPVNNNQKYERPRFRVRFAEKLFEINYFTSEETSTVPAKKIDYKIKDAQAPEFLSKLAQNKKEMSQLGTKQHSIRLENRFDDILPEVLSWKVQSLYGSEQDIRLNPSKTLHVYDSFEKFKDTMFPLMKLELWASIKQDFKLQYNSPYYQLTLISNSIDNKIKSIQFRCSYNLCNTREKLPFNVGVICLLKLKNSENKSDLEIFGYIRYIRRIENFQESYFEIGIECKNDTYIQHSLHNNKYLQIKSITSVRTELTSFNAIFSLKHSPLLDNVLDPKKNILMEDVCVNNIIYKGYDKMLNKNQKDVLLKAYKRGINVNNPNITLIEGPPGTGKSVVITNLVLQFLYGHEVGRREKKILICSQSNTAIDVICSKLIHIRFKMSSNGNKFNLVRYGIYDKMNTKVKGVSTQSLAKNYIQQTRTDNSVQQQNLNKEKAFLESEIARLQKNSQNNVDFDDINELKRQLKIIDRIIHNHISYEEMKNIEKNILQKANIVCTTLQSAMTLLPQRRNFDICIIDEATQCTEVLSLIPLQFGISSLILVGDIRQLPATVLSKTAKELGLGNSLFSRIQKSIGENSNILTLNEQYRMHPAISFWPNKYFYKNKIKNALPISCLNTIFKPYVVLNVNFEQNLSKQNGKIYNYDEAKFVKNVIKYMSKSLSSKQHQYGIITPYAHQRDVIKELMNEAQMIEVAVNTIDSYQGKEKDVIIMSLARTRGVGFLAYSERLNVALTRAKMCLILVGNFSIVESVNSWKSLLDDAKERKLFYNIPKEYAADVENKVIPILKIKK